MKQNKDWTDAMRSALRDAEVTPPAGGWQRLERELGAAAPSPKLRRVVYWPRIAAAAAAVLICVAGGEILWQSGRGLDNDGVVIATADGGGAAEFNGIAAPKEPQYDLGVVASAQSVQPLTGALAQMGPAQRMLEAPNGEENLRMRLAKAVLAPQPQTSEAEGVSETIATDAEVKLFAASTSEKSAEPVESVSSAVAQASAATPDAKTTEMIARAKNRSSSTSYRAPDAERFVAYAPPRKQASMGLFAGGAVTGGTTTSKVVTRSILNLPMADASGATLTQSRNYENYSFRHHQPLSFGLSVRKEFPYGLSLESGVTYTYLSSSVRLRFASEDLHQQLHFVGIPLRLNWQFFESRGFSLYMGAGGMAEKCVAAKFGSMAMKETQVQWSTSGAVGAQYRLGSLVGLYFEPEVAYYFTKTNLHTARTESPLTFTLRLGVRFTF